MASMLELLLGIENIRKKWKILEIFNFQVASTSDATSSWVGKAASVTQVVNFQFVKAFNHWIPMASIEEPHELLWQSIDAGDQRNPMRIDSRIALMRLAGQQERLSWLNLVDFRPDRTLHWISARTAQTESDREIENFALLYPVMSEVQESFNCIFDPSIFTVFQFAVIQFTVIQFNALFGELPMHSLQWNQTFNRFKHSNDSNRMIRYAFIRLDMHSDPIWAEKCAFKIVQVWKLSNVRTLSSADWKTIRGRYLR